MTKRAVVVGARGQDGRLLAVLLKSEGYRLSLLGRSGPVRAADFASVAAHLRAFKPHEVYYLAAFHHSAQDKMPDRLALFDASWQVHVLGLLNFLEAIRRFSPKARLFYASSSRVFGPSGAAAKDESSPLDPQDPYAVTKAAGMGFCRLYRERYGLFASTGILFNHESPLRGPNFVSQRIVRGLSDVKRGRSRRLVLGDLSAKADWGWAPDYVEAMRRILAHRKADDFVIATGRLRTVGQFAAEAARQLGLPRSVIAQSGKALRPSGGYAGKAAKLKRATGWRPTVGFEEMVGKLLA